MDLVYLYYDNPQMLAVQLDHWNAYAGVLRALPTILLVDDGSPRTRAADIVRQRGCRLPIKVFRIHEDIAWNFPGARNLGCTHAHDWIFVSDIDTLLPAKDAKTLFESRPLDRQCAYRPRRVMYPDGKECSHSSSALLFHKEQYLRIGGYDEDYAGHYGKDDRDFLIRLKVKAKIKIVEVNDAVIQAVPTRAIPDAETVGKRRNPARNERLMLKKYDAGFANPDNPLRFTWEQVL